MESSPTRHISGDLAEMIVSHMPTPHTATLSTSASAARDLYNVMQVSSSFFFPASESLWATCPSIHRALGVLYGGLGLEKTSHYMEDSLEQEAVDIL